MSALAAAPRPLHDSPSSGPVMAISPVRLPMPPRRFADQAEATRINNQIDEELRREHDTLRRRRPREIKVMLLGQAESGKSTLQKQFQLYYACQTLDRERPSWRPIVYFNILKAIRMILSEVDYEYFSNTPTSPLMPSPVDHVAHLRNKLLPLVASEEALASELSGGITVTGGKSGVFVRAGWQALNTATRSWPLADIRNGSGPRAPVMTDIVAKTLDANQNEIEDLWHHPGVRSLLATNKLRLEEYAEFFLDNIHRIARPDYLPSTDDILHVRLQTLGVKEHAFDINMGGVTYNWLLYDVGGARGQ
ncbi:hypothetical protein EVJ58_g10536, partial [Rhodofomes roseus]